MSSEHFVFKNKLCFYLYQQHFHCLISGRQRQKDGNSERKKLRAELILKWNKVCYFNAAEEHFLWITTTWLIFFTVFWQNADFWRGKKKKRTANIIQPVVLWSVIWQTVLQSPCKPVSAWRAEVANSTQLQHQCLVWGSLGIPCWHLGLDPAAFPQTIDFSKGGWCWSCCLHLCQQFKY